VLSDNAFEFGFFGNAFVRLIRALDAIQSFVAFGWEQLRYFIHAARSGCASEASEAVRIPDGLADLEPMIAQMAPPYCVYFRSKTVPRNRGSRRVR
jgi:hypothetical protein